jgi:hypothetical protein
LLQHQGGQQRKSDKQQEGRQVTGQGDGRRTGKPGNRIDQRQQTRCPQGHVANQLRPEGRGRIDVQRFTRRHPHRLAGRLQRRQHRHHDGDAEGEQDFPGVQGQSIHLHANEQHGHGPADTGQQVLTSRLLIGRANSHPHKADKGPFAHEQAKKRRPDAPVARMTASSRRRAAALRATRLYTRNMPTNREMKLKKVRLSW